MRIQAITIITTTLAAISIPSHVLAQQNHSASRPGLESSRARSTVPRQPVARGVAHAEPLAEPQRPPTSVPYVRDEHWYGHASPDDGRFRLPHPFAHGYFALPGPTHIYSAIRVDLGARRIWLSGGEFDIADWDWPATAPWCWTCDQLVVYVDPDHPGWYLVYDVRMGEYVHAQFLGA